MVTDQKFPRLRISFALGNYGEAVKWKSEHGWVRAALRTRSEQSIVKR